MSRSPGFRLFVVGLLILLMFIPVFFVGSIIDARADYNRGARASVGEEWGGRQMLSGPALVIPVEETVTVRERREVLDPETGLQTRDADDKPVYRHVDVQKTLRRAPVHLYPVTLVARVDAQTQERRRGIFTVPVDSAATAATGVANSARAAAAGASR